MHLARMEPCRSKCSMSKGDIYFRDFIRGLLFSYFDVANGICKFCEKLIIPIMLLIQRLGDSLNSGENSVLCLL